MSQLIGAEPPQSANPPQTRKSLLPDPSLLASLPAKIIQITGHKKKKEIIEIEDSEEEAVPEKAAWAPDRKAPAPGRKQKRPVHRCLLCKQPGKKINMKACIDCKTYAHLACLEQEGESGTRYRCRKCKHKREETQPQRKAEKNEKAGQQKMAFRRLEKQKRREEQQKKMQFFQERFPYYFQEDKIKFPIEDRLLFLYRELFDVTEGTRPRPQAHPHIPAPLLSDYLQIENFFSTFREQLKDYGQLPNQMRKSCYYLSLKSEGLDGVFSCLLECILKVYLSDIFDKNKTDNVRILNEHPFFTLLTHLHDNAELSQEVVVKAAREIFRYLATIPSMRTAFDSFDFPTTYSLLAKTQLIVGLIRGLSEIDEFHELVSIKSERMQQLTKEKTELVAQLKIDEAEILSNNEKLKDMALAGVEMEQSQDGTVRALSKEIDKHKKKIQKLATQQTKSEETIKDIRTKIGEIARTMPFLTSEVYFLGLDRNNSEYFFYVREPHRVYVKYRSYFLDTNQNFLIYEGREVISEIAKQLNTKGVHERHLCENMSSFLKDDIIVNFPSNDDISTFMQQENRFTPITLEDILNTVRDTEQRFTKYLNIKHYQWAAPQLREVFLQQFMTLTDLQTIKEQIRILQEHFLFAEHANTDGNGKLTDGNKQDDDSEEEMKVDGKEGRKKVPIRIWGINSEKTKKYWLEYLQECVDQVGIWLCAFIFKNNVEKYVKKKLEAYQEQQLKQQKYRAREGRERGRPPILRNLDRQPIERPERRQPPPPPKETSSEPIEEEEQEYRRPNLRKRNLKRMNIESESEHMELTAKEDENNEESQSSNEDCCEECGEYGDMICCDTCPKVYHANCLKMKDIPEGDWSCYKCLEKLASQRQTRSRVKKMSKFI